MPLRFLHADMDAFFAAIEQLDHPEWRGKPVVVGAPPDCRGVVCTASYEARRFGIHSAMPSREAGRRCPHAIFTPPNGKRYTEVSHKIFSIFENFTPLVEPVSVDEAFMDVSGATSIFGPPPDIAEKIRKAVKEETGLTISIGVAPNKFLAKLASDMNKPDGMTVTPTDPDEIIRFLAPLPVERIWGVGRVMRETLNRAGINTVYQLQQTSREVLSRIIGRHASNHLQNLAFGLDKRDITSPETEKSISKEHTFATDCRDPHMLRQTLFDLTEDVGRRTRSNDLFASVGRLKLRWNNFETITRQRHFTIPASDDFTFREFACELLCREPLIRPVRLIGFGVTGLSSLRTEQLNLFLDSSVMEKRERLSSVIDKIRRRYGDKIIQRGAHHPENPAKRKPGRE